jgi:hypothetical protein
MISLDIQTGSLQLGELLIKRDLVLQKIEVLKQQYEIVDSVMNPPYKSYRLPNLDNGYAGAALYFYGDKLTNVDLALGSKFNFPSFEITTQEIKLVKKLLTELGGEKDYAWGKVEYSEDAKGGRVGLWLSYF